MNVSRGVARNGTRNEVSLTDGTDESGAISILHNLLASAFEQRYTTAEALQFASTRVVFELRQGPLCKLYQPTGPRTNLRRSKVLHWFGGFVILVPLPFPRPPRYSIASDVISRVLNGVPFRYWLLVVLIEFNLIPGSIPDANI